MSAVTRDVRERKVLVAHRNWKIHFKDALEGGFTNEICCIKSSGVSPGKCFLVIYGATY